MNMFGLGSQELIIILVIAFFIFGAKRLPELGKGLGQSIRGFKKSMETEPEETPEPESIKGQLNASPPQSEGLHESQDKENPMKPA
jgi:sec-independent protein translocase protein TatA